MWCIIIPFLTAIIGAILGWLLRHLTCKCNDDDLNIEIEKNKKLTDALTKCHSDKQALSVDLSGVKGELAESKVQIETLSKSVDVPEIKEEVKVAETKSTLGFISDAVDTEPALIFDGGLAKAIFGKKIKADDLTVVEGIGPKISQLYNDAGIKTWYQLSTTPVEKSKEILNAGGPRFLMHKPDSWAKQAGLAFSGKWEELKELQDYLDGGVEKK